MEVGSSSDGWAATQVKNFMSVVTRGKWRRFKKRHMGLVLGKRELGVEKGKKLEMVVVGPRNEGNGLPSCGARERKIRRGCPT
jgi:ABC-type lipoprotein release transport system permease subunit